MTKLYINHYGVNRCSVLKLIKVILKPALKLSTEI